MYGIAAAVEQWLSRTPEEARVAPVDDEPTAPSVRPEEIAAIEALRHRLLGVRFARVAPLMLLPLRFWCTPADETEWCRHQCSDQRDATACELRCCKEHDIDCDES